MRRLRSLATARGTASGAIRVCLVAPLPPPVGGIAQWTKQLLQLVRVRPDITVVHIDTALCGRRVDELRTSRRLAIGARQIVGQLWRVHSALAKGVDVLHLTTSGHLGVIR